MKELIEKTFDGLISKGLSVDNGLTLDEVRAIEGLYNFEFPLDILSFLKHGLPQGPQFPDWRGALTDKSMIDFESVTQGIIFDIENNDFWWDKWGKKPTDHKERELIALKMIKSYPKLIPLFSHRYLPAKPNHADNPVFSIVQTDIIYYGQNIYHYFQIEFGLKTFEKAIAKPKTPKDIEFWTGLHNWNNFS
jgi:hypothetical protein